MFLLTLSMCLINCFNCHKDEIKRFQQEEMKLSSIKDHKKKLDKPLIVIILLYDRKNFKAPPQKKKEVNNLKTKVEH